MSSNCVNVYIEIDGFSSTYSREFSFRDSSCNHLDLTITGVFALGGFSGILLKKSFQFWNITALFTSRSSHRATYLLRCLLKQVKGSSLNLKIRVEFSVILFMYICVCACICTSGNRQLELGKNCTFCYLSCFPADSIQNCLYISPSMGRACCVSPSLKDTIFISGIAHMYFSDTW